MAAGAVEGAPPRCGPENVQRRRLHATTTVARQRYSAAAAVRVDAQPRREASRARAARAPEALRAAADLDRIAPHGFLAVARRREGRGVAGELCHAAGARVDGGRAVLAGGRSHLLPRALWCAVRVRGLVDFVSERLATFFSPSSPPFQRSFSSVCGTGGWYKKSLKVFVGLRTATATSSCRLSRGGAEGTPQAPHGSSTYDAVHCGGAEGTPHLELPHGSSTYDAGVRAWARKSASAGHARGGPACDPGAS